MALKLFVAALDRAKVRRRGAPDAGVELPQHRQVLFLHRIVFDRVCEFGHVSERHGSLGNGVLTVKRIRLIIPVVAGIVRH